MGGEFWFQRYSDVSRGSVLAPCGLSGTKASLVGLVYVCVIQHEASPYIGIICKYTILCLFVLLWNQ
jgi:hypothetical protein